MIRFANPWLLVLWLFIPLVVYMVRIFDRRLISSFRFSSGELLKNLKPSFRTRLKGKMIYVRAAAIFFLILAAARPQSVTEKTRIHVEGIDIVLAVDVSTSMLAMDFGIGTKRVNRLEVVKTVVEDFIKRRLNDRIGIVAFSGLAYTVCPLTLDHQWLDKNLERVQIGMIKDGTAIGSAITASLNRLRDSKSKGKIIILLTDGRNNAGRVSPLAAAEAAKTLGVRIYTIGAGTKGMAPYPFKDSWGNTVLRPIKIDIDDELLQKIADKTDGMYFRATDTESLERIYDKIDKLEKTPIEETGYNIYKELFAFFLVPGLMLLLLEIVLANTYLRKIP